MEFVLSIRFLGTGLTHKNLNLPQSVTYLLNNKKLFLKLVNKAKLAQEL